MSKILKIIVFFLTLSLLIGLGLGNYFHNVVFKRETYHGYNQYEQCLGHGKCFDREWFQKQQKVKLSIPSTYGYTLDALLIPHPDTVANTVILTHGIGSDKWGAMKFGEMFQREGFNLLLYDHSKHGQSGGNRISYGHFEKEDLAQVVSFARKRYPEGMLGVHGESYGAATAGLHAAMNETDEAVSFYIMDCSYSDIYNLFAYHLEKDYGIPNLFIVDFANWITQWRQGFGFEDMSPINAMSQASTPILFIHGAKDTFTPARMTEELYQAKHGPKRMHLFEQAGHGQSFNNYPEAYEETVHMFLRDMFPKKQ